MADQPEILSIIATRYDRSTTTAPQVLLRVNKVVPFWITPGGTRDRSVTRLHSGVRAALRPRLTETSSVIMSGTTPLD